MGANQSCCAYSTPRTGSKKDKNRKEVERQDDKYEPRQVSKQIISLLRIPSPDLTKEVRTLSHDSFLIF